MTKLNNGKETKERKDSQTLSEPSRMISDLLFHRYFIFKNKIFGLNMRLLNTHNQNWHDESENVQHPVLHS